MPDTPNMRPGKPPAASVSKAAAASAPGLSPAEILLGICKHKWKVLICTVAGICAAAVFYSLSSPQYQSDAMLLVRYVVERSGVDAVASAGDAANKPSDSVLNSEVEILRSWDLFEQVAQQVGVNKLCPKSKDPSPNEAASVIASGLSVTAVPDTSVILVSYKNSDPELAPIVLEDLLEAYFVKHLDIHRSKAAFDLVSQQTDMIGAQLAKTEDELKKKKAAAGILSLQDTATNLNVELADTQNQIANATTALAEQRALVAELEIAIGAGGD